MAKGRGIELAPLVGAAPDVERLGPGDKRPPATRSEDGFGIIESVIAFVVLLAVLIPTSMLLEDTTSQAATANDRVTATELAEQVLETVAQEPLTQLDNQLNTTQLVSTRTVGGETYFIYQTLSWTGTGAQNQPDLCLSGSPPQVVEAGVVVKWGPGQADYQTETSVIDPPYSNQLGDGYIAVQLTGTLFAHGRYIPHGVTGLAVAISPSTPPGPFQPDGNGCVYVPEAPGSYTVTLSSPGGGYLDWTGASSQTQTGVTVTAGVTTSVVFNPYDEAATVRALPPVGPLASGVPFSAANSGTPSGGFETDTSGQDSLTLYPFSSVWRGWFGSCAAPPELPASPTTFSTTAGASTEVSVAGLDTLAFSLSSPSDGPVTGATGAAVVASVSGNCQGDVGSTYGFNASTDMGNATDLEYQVPAESYTVYLCDGSVPAGSCSASAPAGDLTSVTVTWTAVGWSVGGTLYPFDGSTPIPETVP